MNIWKSALKFFSKRKQHSAPLLIITKESHNSDIKEFRLIEEALNELAKDPNTDKEKLLQIKSSIEILKENNVIKVKV